MNKKEKCIKDLLNLPEHERKQLIIILAGSMLNDIPRKKAFKISNKFENFFIKN